MKIELTTSHDNAEASDVFITVVHEAMCLIGAAVEAYHVIPFKAGTATPMHDLVAQHLGNMLGNSFTQGVYAGQYCYECKAYTFGDESIFMSPCEDHETVQLYVDIPFVRNIVDGIQGVIEGNNFYPSPKVSANEHIMNGEREMGILTGVVHTFADNEEELYDIADEICEKLSKHFERKFFADVEEPVGRFFKLYVC